MGEQPPDTPSDESRRLQAEAELRAAIKKADAAWKRAQEREEEMRREAELLGPPQSGRDQSFYPPAAPYLRFPPQRKDRT